MTDKEKDKKKKNKRKADEAPMPAKEHKENAKKLRTKTQKALRKATGKNY